MWRPFLQGHLVWPADPLTQQPRNPNHDYSNHPQGKHGVWNGEQAGRNGQRAGGWRHLRSIADATEVLPPEKLKRSALRQWSTAKRCARQAGGILFYDVWHTIWFALIGLTRPFRGALRLRLRL